MHQEVLFTLLKFDAEILGACITEQLIRRLVDFSYAVIDYPRFVIPLKPRKDLVAESQAVLNLVTMGARVPERSVHEELGILVAEGDEPLLVAPRQQPTPMEGDEGGTFPGGGEDGDEDEDLDDVDPEGDEA